MDIDYLTLMKPAPFVLFINPCSVAQSTPYDHIRVKLSYLFFGDYDHIYS